MDAKKCECGRLIYYNKFNQLYTNNPNCRQCTEKRRRNDSIKRNLWSDDNTQLADPFQEFKMAFELKKNIPFTGGLHTDEDFKKHCIKIIEQSVTEYKLKTKRSVDYKPQEIFEKLFTDNLLCNLSNTLITPKCFIYHKHTINFGGSSAIDLSFASKYNQKYEPKINATCEKLCSK